jgi:hypothetical protein
MGNENNDDARSIGYIVVGAGLLLLGFVAPCILLPALVIFGIWLACTKLGGPKDGGICNGNQSVS